MVFLLSMSIQDCNHQIKLIERWNKSDDISLRHREDMIREMNDLSEKISYLSGRINSTK